MSRPCCKKNIVNFQNHDGFSPNKKSVSSLDTVILTLDELEALRLADYLGLYQEAAARAMGISRQTFGRIIETARKKNSRCHT